MRLREETRRATRMLLGKVVRRVVRHRKKEVLVEFSDGTRLYVDWQPTEELELSITEGV